jgi:hypothetical protein
METYMRLFDWTALQFAIRDLVLPLVTGITGYVISQRQANRTFVRERVAKLSTLHSIRSLK